MKKAALETKIKEKTSLRKDIIVPRANREAVPLSFAQQRLWFIEQLVPGSPVHNLCGAVRLKGLLQVEVLQKSLNEILVRHEILRTALVINEGQAIQNIAPSVVLRLSQIDLSHHREETRLEEIRNLIQKEEEQPFDLSKAPLLKAILYRLSSQEHVLLLKMHHVISDEWSFGVLYKELFELYRAFSSGRYQPLPKLPAQYADYVYWQRDWLEGDELESLLAYWRKQLQNAPGLLQLPADHPRPSILSFRGAGFSQEIPRDLVEQLKSFTRFEHATLFMTLLAAFQLLLHYYTRETDVVVGSPVAGRNQVEIENLIGCFVNTLALRTQFSGNPSFREVLRRVRATTLDAYSHQDMPFEKLVQELHPERSLSHSPLFQVMFVFQNSIQPSTESNVLSVEPFEIEPITAKYDLTIVLEENNGLKANWEYSTDLFLNSTIQRISDHFVHLIKEVLKNPDLPISQLSLLSELEERQILYDWNQTASVYPSKRCIHHLFEEQVLRTPDSDVAVFGNEKITYAQLNGRANQLAHQLMEKGTRPNTLVGICMNRSLELAVGLLGILKAGAAYVPIDPQYPKERMQFILKDAEISSVLTQDGLLSQLPEGAADYICLDRDWPQISKFSDKNPQASVSPEDLVYVIYTSGSTGQPKGVLIPHRALVNHSTALARQYGLGPQDRILQFASISFDVAGEEIYPAWLSGSLVIFRNEEMLSSFGRFFREVDELKITMLNLPTAFWQEMSHEMNTSNLTLPDCVRLVVIGSERASYSAWQCWNHVSGNKVQFFNCYGPTETTITSTIYEPAANPWTHESISDLPIGRPIANMRSYILNPYGKPVPINVPGELCIAGVGVAKGYLNRPELTVEKFADYELPNKTHERIYRTGDLVRYLPDGNLQFFGRIDQQLKIRGFRIEAGEIETILHQHPSVKDAIVTTADVGTEKRLIAYVVRNSNVVFNLQDLKEFVQQRLPEYMVPAFIVPLDRLPLTPNGKVNYKALPRPEVKGNSQAGHVAPRDGLELQLAAIWERMLSVKSISINDNFFELGGHSLLAVRVFSEIEKLTGKDLPLATLFQAPTIEQLADVLRHQGWSSSWSCLVPIQTGGNEQPFFCIHAVGGNVLGYRDLAYHLADRHPVYGLQARGLDGTQPPHLRIEDMAADYIQEIRRVQAKGPYFLGGLSSGGVVALEMALQLKEQGEMVAMVAMFDTDFPAGVTLSKSELYRQRWNDWLVRTKYHFRNIFLGTERLSYLRKKGKTVRRKIRSSIWQFLFSMYQNLGRPLPNALLKVREASRQALKQYTPRFYKGEITLFLASDLGVGGPFDPEKEWLRIAQKVHLEKVPGDHLSMLEEPNVRVLASRLKEVMLAKKNAASVLSLCVNLAFALL